MRRQTTSPEQSAVEKLGELFDEHHTRLYRLGLRLVSDAEEARDLLQETFLRAARQRNLPSEPSAVSAWLTRTLVNLTRDHHRRRAVRLKAEPGLRQSTTTVAPSAEGPLEAKSTVRAALNTLPHRKRAILVLHELEELTVAEISRALTLSQATVRWHLAGSRKRLAKLLQPSVPCHQEVRSVR